MTDVTAKLSLPVMMPAQAQKHVTHNEALELLDLIVQLTLESDQAAIAPPSPQEGQSWGIGVGATGVWAGRDGMIASWRGGGWLFVNPAEGWTAWCKSDLTLKVYSGGSWQPLAALAP
ncbi:DUF2793 domain-containing protein [Yoonia litorea]|nr:DUF2793 domain-containing protein [Yoonia litorea]